MFEFIYGIFFIIMLMEMFLFLFLYIPFFIAWKGGILKKLFVQSALFEESLSTI
jgi:hypothetical protein